MKRPETGKKVKLNKEESEVTNYRNHHHNVVYHYYQFADNGQHVSNDNLDTVNMLHSIKLDVLKLYTKDAGPKKKSDIITLNHLKKAWISQTRKKGD